MPGLKKEAGAVYRSWTLGCLFLALVGCGGAVDDDFIAVNGFDSGELTDLSRRVLTDLQEPSFLENVEYCGLIVLDPDGELVALPHNRGNHSNCEILAQIPKGWKFAGHYHTHGGFDPKKFAEVPSVDDMTYLIQSGIIGFLATPGGRFWRIDGSDQNAELICGPGCLPQDPYFDERYEPKDRIQKTYTINEIRSRRRNKNDEYLKS